ncbi:uncharacterized protein LOC127119046 isoform X2 [Lathyrus oleraceus]|uniref:uncharacterized protein LOC127119046 isoform X2 n=1 Tax=Pisum sativum TaxID=3888 RepID=UPI0021D1D839|nr:uncharacterized protein LOC127119046 isoform X2 [Pisum sativum]
MFRTQYKLLSIPKMPTPKLKRDACVQAKLPAARSSATQNARCNSNYTIQSAHAKTLQAAKLSYSTTQLQRKASKYLLQALMRCTKPKLKARSKRQLRHENSKLCKPQAAVKIQKCNISLPEYFLHSFVFSSSSVTKEFLVFEDHGLWTKEY